MRPTSIGDQLMRPTAIGHQLSLPLSLAGPRFTCALLRRLHALSTPRTPPSRHATSAASHDTASSARSSDWVPFAPLKAQFSTMAPGVHVRPHTGPTNAKLTVHYGLQVPDGAAIRVAGGSWRPFVERGLLVFDDSYEHEVWQNGTSDRTTLVLHVAHPDLARAFSEVVRAD